MRIATVIGLVFSSDVLDSAAPPPMRPYLSTILSSLVGGYWLTCRTVRQPHGVRLHYSFRHPLVRSMLYDLLPETFRCSTHLSVAEYLEQGCSKQRSTSLNNDNQYLSFPSSNLPDAEVKRSGSQEQGYIDNAVDTPTRYQHTLLCTAYHYSLSGMPAWKTMEYLCKACDDLVSGSTVVSFVSAEAAVKLVHWSTKLVRSIPEIVVVSQ